MKLVESTITRSELREFANETFGNLVKAVVDIEKNLMVIDADLHSDQEAWLIELGSDQNDLWGINLYPDIPGSDWIEFDSMINVRPRQGNRSRSVDDPELRERIRNLVLAKVTS
jgi:hypothetical protein